MSRRDAGTVSKDAGPYPKHGTHGIQHKLPPHLRMTAPNTEKVLERLPPHLRAAPALVEGQAQASSSMCMASDVKAEQKVYPGMRMISVWEKHLPSGLLSMNAPAQSSTQEAGPVTENHDSHLPTHLGIMHKGSNEKVLSSAPEYVVLMQAQTSYPRPATYVKSESSGDCLSSRKTVSQGTEKNRQTMPAHMAGNNPPTQARPAWRSEGYVPPHLRERVEVVEPSRNEFKPNESTTANPTKSSTDAAIPRFVDLRAAAHAVMAVEKIKRAKPMVKSDAHTAMTMEEDIPRDDATQDEDDDDGASHDDRSYPSFRPAMNGTAFKSVDGPISGKQPAKSFANGDDFPSFRFNVKADDNDRSPQSVNNGGYTLHSGGAIHGNKAEPQPVVPVPLAEIKRKKGRLFTRPQTYDVSSMSAHNSDVGPTQTWIANFVDRAAPGVDGSKFYNPYNEEETLEDEYFESHLYRRWIAAWLGDVDFVADPLDLSKENNEFCDVDVETVKYLDPVWQPLTFPARPERSCGFLHETAIWRQFNHTANYRIRAFRDLLCRHADHRNAIFTQLEDYKKIGYENVWNKQEYNEFGGPRIHVKADFILRPATVNDMAAVAAIYAMEMSTGNQAVHVNLSHESAMLKLWEVCQEELLPFIVAVGAPGTMTIDMEQVPNEHKKSFQEFLDFRAERAKYTRQPLLGFAFMTPYNHSDLSGRIEDDSSINLNLFSAKLEFFVHPNHRRQGVGHSLLDRMVSFTSTMCTRLPGYTWQPAGNNNIYSDNAIDTARPLHCLYISSTFPASIKDDDPELKWRDVWFSANGCFDRLGRFPRAVRRPGRERLETVVWGTKCHSIEHMATWRSRQLRMGGHP